MKDLKIAFTTSHIYVARYFQGRIQSTPEQSAESLEASGNKV